jgi:proline dehydrogenase
MNLLIFGKIYDEINKGGTGYSAFKYVPYGPLEEVLPYLSRRAIENGKGVFEKVDKEKRLIRNELKRRLTSKN